jgi:hypothetical protein
MFCPNHPETVADQTCAFCRKQFCDSCVVHVGDQPLCAACKEERIREMKSGVPTPLNSTGPEYWPIGVRRLAVMTVATLGLYQLIWFYQQWTWIKRRDGRNISPIGRTLFSVFFMRQLFEDINKHGRARDNVPKLHSVALIVWWLICQVATNAPTPWSLLSSLAVFTFLPPQRAINAINLQAAPTHDRNERFTTWNIVTLVIFALWWLLILAGLATGTHE